MVPVAAPRFNITECNTERERRELIGRITEALEERDRLVVLLYYFEHMTMKEIGVTLGLSESRVCQIHRRIMRQLRTLLAPQRSRK